MVRARVSAGPLAALLVLLSVTAACGGDELPSAPPSGAATSSLPSLAASTPGGSCTPAPTVASPATDSFSDQVCLVTSASGLRLGDITTGSGAQPQKGQNVVVQYTGWLTDGREFDSSRSPGRSPFHFAIGTGAVIPGWDEGLMTMRAGGKRKLVIPPGLAYGAAGSGSTIPPNATLVFEVELVSVG